MSAIRVLVRQLYDCSDVAVGLAGVRCRVVVATHPKGETKSRIGLTRKGVVYELFVTSLPRDATTFADVVALYLHRGADCACILRRLLTPI